MVALDRLSETEVSGIMLATTIVHLAVLPFADVAVIDAEPLANAVTRPMLSTCATLVFEEVQVSVLSEALDGEKTGLSE